ncbi:MAG: NHL repeat-containing protein, partial [Acidimicrobiia bacterium]|nr:NHL repeat-containing protein [Acidimicrobiia bacterium]
MTSMFRQIRIRAVSVLAAAGLAAGLATAVAPTARAAAPTYDKTLVGASLAAMYPSGFEYDAANNRLVVADTGLDRILFYSLTGTKLGEFGSPGTADGQFLSPRDAAVDPSGNIYVGDAENNRIQKFTSAGVWQWTVGGVGACNTCLNTPIGVTWDAANSQLLVASTGQNLVKAFDTAGTYLWKSPASGTASGQIDVSGERDVTRGPDGRLWITDYKHHQMKAFTVDAAGNFTDADANATNGVTPVLTLGTGEANGHGDNQLNFPYNMVFSSESGGHFTAYVADTGNGRVARYDIDNTNPAAPTAT